VPDAQSKKKMFMLTQNIFLLHKTYKTFNYFIVYVVRRKKGVLTREKCKLFLKHHCSVQQDGIWRIKVSRLCLLI